VPTLEVVVANAATTMAEMVIWAATDIPATVAAAAIVPAPAAADVPADAEAWTAIV
jgi:hypothetical protein